MVNKRIHIKAELVYDYNNGKNPLSQNLIKNINIALIFDRDSINILIDLVEFSFYLLLLQNTLKRLKSCMTLLK